MTRDERRTFSATTWVAWILVAALTATTATAISWPSSDVLVPQFEVDLAAPQRTTLFAVGNDALSPVTVQVTVFTTWGIAVLRETVVIPAEAVLSVNLRDWLVQGVLPTRTLSSSELANLQAMLAGEPSPLDGKYYGSSGFPGRMTGYVTVRDQELTHADSLWGDYFTVAGSFSQGETLVNLDRTVEYEPGCSEHGIRFLQNARIGTELNLWTDRHGLASATPEPPASALVTYRVTVYDEAGNVVDRLEWHLLPSAVVDIASLDLPRNFGWLEISSDSEFFTTGHFTESGQSSALHSYCLPSSLHRRGSGLVVAKYTNGLAAEVPPGPTIAVGSAVTWEYVVTNDGQSTIASIDVIDDKGVVPICPKTTLEPGESMTCVAHGVAEACQYENGVRATGLDASNTRVNAYDVSHYFGDAHPAIDVEKTVDGEDADTPPGPSIQAGKALAWTFVVTNTGGVRLHDVVVTDDSGLTIACPKTALAVAESMTCTASSYAQVGMHLNLATASALPECGARVAHQDPAYYTGVGNAAIAIKKLTNGEDADLPPGPSLLLGSPVYWSYLVTNVGSQSLANVTVSDDKGVAVSCPKSVLTAGESMTCTASGTATLGQYVNVGTASGKPAVGPVVTASDPSHYLGVGNAAIRIQKLVNGDDANTPPGPSFDVGTALTWQYVVTNVGTLQLASVLVTDDRGVAVSCPKSVLAAGESMTCTGQGVATYGQYHNVGTATGTPPAGSAVTASDPAYYVGTGTVAIDIKKYTNGDDANDRPGPTIKIGTTVTWTYVVKNTGNVALKGVIVTDDRLVTVACPKSELVPGESMTCVASGKAVAGQYDNVGTATGTPVGGTAVSHSDPSHYYGRTCTQGCSAGYWKTHPSAWAATGYSTTQKLVDVFAGATHYSTAFQNTTLLAALAFAGGSTTEGAAQILARQAVAALLNASHPGVSYPRTPGAVIADANVALASENRDAMLTLAAALDADNNQGCPLH